jgi:hypothetical protein
MIWGDNVQKFSGVRRMQIRWRSAAVMVLGLTAALGLAGKCIDRTSVYVDADGYTHLVGQMNNDTSIQGTSIVLRGTLYDAQDNVIATKDAPTCPPDTQPNTQSLFDIRFDNPGVPPHARYTVQAISGKAMSAALPDPDVVILQNEAIRYEGIPPIPGFPITDNDVLFRFGVRNRGDHAYPGIQGCAAVYDHFGNVIYAESTEIVSFDEDGNISPATLGNQAPGTIYMIAKDVALGPVQVRAWIWFGPKGSSTSAYQYVETPLMTIQTRKF